MNKLHQEDVRKFYVYELFRADGVQYVGKGSGGRLEAQKRRFAMDGRVVKRFASEAAAYKFEKAHIETVQPPLNKCAGGNGSRAARQRAPAWVREIERVGTRVYAARLALQYIHLLDPAKVGDIRRVAYGV